MEGLKDKVAIVTGGATLIGAAWCALFTARERKWRSPTSTRKMDRRLPMNCGPASFCENGSGG